MYSRYVINSSENLWCNWGGLPNFEFIIYISFIGVSVLINFRHFEFSFACLFVFNSVQIRCIVKANRQKSPLFWRFSGGFWFSQDSLGIPQETPLNLIKSPIFTNAPCKTACLYNAPSMHTVDVFFPFLTLKTIVFRPLSPLQTLFGVFCLQSSN